MPHNGSHIVDVETWWCKPGRQKKKKSIIVKKFHSKSGTKKSGSQCQPPIQLKFLSNHKSITIEWGELVDGNSEILPIFVGKEEGVDFTWKLKGKTILKHDAISNIKVHHNKVVKLEICIKGRPQLRWGEQSWNTSTNRNNRTNWESEASEATCISRWPEHFGAIQSCKTIFIVPKQKHQKKLVSLVEQLSLDFPSIFRRSNFKRLNTSVSNEKFNLSTRELQQAAKVLQDDDTQRTCDAREPLFSFEDNHDHLLLTPPLDPWHPKVDNDILKILPQLSPPTSPKFKRKSGQSLMGAPKRLKTDISYGKLRAGDSLCKTQLLALSTTVDNKIMNKSKAKSDEKGARRRLKIPGTTSHLKKKGFNNRTRSIRKKRIHSPTMERSLAQLGYSRKHYEPLRLNVLEKNLSSMVEEAFLSTSKDWAGSGSNEQVGILIDFFEALEAPLQSVIKVGIEGSVAFECCHEALLIIAEQWNNMKNVPMPGGVTNTLMQQRNLSLALIFENIQKETRNQPLGHNEPASKVVFRASDGQVDFILKELWTMLLISTSNAATSDGIHEVLDETICQMIKDAVDYCEHNSFDSLANRNSRLGMLFLQREKWGHLPTHNGEYSFDSPRGGPLKTLDDQENRSAGTKMEQIGTKYIRPKGMNSMFNTTHHTHLRLGMQRSDSWDNFLGADDSPYK